jgi:poly-gamma-glutamate synthesis protein (capsule biosynthesis protein)
MELVDDPDLAVVKVVPGGEAIVSTWIYTLVASFPTTVDGMTWETLLSLWSDSEGSEPILVSETSQNLLETILGPAGDNVRVAPEERLIDIAWQLDSAYALIPFEALEPRWKVLELDGQAPIRNDFDTGAYPLKVDLGVNGPEGASERLSVLLDIPSSNHDPDQMTVLMMTGVTALTRATAWQMDRRGVEFPAQKIGDWLAEADLTHISHEVAFADDCPLPDPEQEGLKFCSDPTYIELLELVGTDIVELTGNHLRDYGSDALDYTLAEYNARGWGMFGGGEDLEAAYEPLTLEHNGNRLAFLGCNHTGPKYAWATEAEPGSTPCEDDVLFDTVAILADQGYQVIFTYQWAERNAVTDAQREAFEAAVDAGAVIVSGSQAHQPLGMSFYKDGFIHYGLGNLFFDQMQTLQLRSELLDRHVFYAGRHISTELLTAMLESYAQPRPMTPEERSVLLREIFEDSNW